MDSRFQLERRGRTWGNASLGYSLRGLTETSRILRQERAGDRYPEDRGACAGKQHAELTLQETREPLDLAGEADGFDVPSLIMNTILHSTQDRVILFALTKYIMNRSQAGPGNTRNVEIPFTSLAEAQYLFIFPLPVHDEHSWEPEYINEKGWVVFFSLLLHLTVLMIITFANFKVILAYFLILLRQKLQFIPVRCTETLYLLLLVFL